MYLNNCLCPPPALSFAGHAGIQQASYDIYDDFELIKNLYGLNGLNMGGSH